MNKLICKYSTKCNETGKPIRKGDIMFYDYATRKCYHPDSYAAKGETTPRDYDREIAEAQENAYFDNFCQTNNI